MKPQSRAYVIYFALFFNALTLLHAQNQDPTLKTISGIVSLEGTPLSNVNILIIGTSSGTKTNHKGYYELEASIGDTLQYSYVGLKSIQVIIEDVTNTLNITMREAKNELDAAIVQVKKRKHTIEELEKRRDVNLQTPYGNINPKTSGFSIRHLQGENLNPGTTSIIREIGIRTGLRVRGTFPNEALFIRNRPATFVVNGIEYKDNPPVFDVNQISDIFIVNQRNLVIIVTKSAKHIKKIETEKIAEKYRNQEFYNNDALPFDSFQRSTSVVEKLKTYSTPEEAYLFYKEQHSLSPEATIDVATYFNDTHPNTSYAKDILKTLRTKYASHPEVLKATAYYFQYFNFRLEAIKTYMHLLNLRPNYGQSYRDLANAYKENDNYTKSWKIYKRFLSNHYDKNNQEFIDLSYNDMEYLFFNRKNQIQLTDAFIPKNKDKKQFKKDIRIVLEWHTSEADFDMEFIGPDGRSFSFKHSNFDNQELINLEKKYGYSSKEFFIDTIGDNEWLINLTYHGNKTEAPTYLKLTTYIQWGTASQKQETQLFKLVETNIKYQLKKIDKSILTNSQNSK
jgi:hypothetical protein